MKGSSKSDNRPSMQFYPDAWLSDPGITVASLQAQGAWIRLLCHMWRSPVRGAMYMANGSRPDNNAIAKLLGVSVAEWEQLLAELLALGIASMDDESTIYNRRMYREWTLQRDRSKAGKKGAEARWSCERHGKSMANNGAPTPTPSPTPTPELQERGDESPAPKVPRKPRTTFQPPTPDEVTEWSAANGCPIDGELFVSYWASVGWKRGNGSPVVDWRQTARNAYLKGIDRKSTDKPHPTMEQTQAALAAHDARHNRILEEAGRGIGV
jgi:uncharacterized protein YdaU (DUF1376 family)